MREITRDEALRLANLDQLQEPTFLTQKQAFDICAFITSSMVAVGVDILVNRSIKKWEAIYSLISTIALTYFARYQPTPDNGVRSFKKAFAQADRFISREDSDPNINPGLNKTICHLSSKHFPIMKKTILIDDNLTASLSFFPDHTMSGISCFMQIGEYAETFKKLTNRELVQLLQTGYRR